MDTFFKKTSLICIFVLIELLLLWFFNYSLGAYIGESGQSFNAFLNEYGGYQFFLAAYSKRLLPYGLLAYFTVCIFIVGKELGNPCFLSSLNQLRLSEYPFFLGVTRNFDWKNKSSVAYIKSLFLAVNFLHN